MTIPPAEWIASPNAYATRAAGDISMIVIHTMDTVGATYAEIIEANTRQRDVGAHYWVRSADGHVTQMIRDLDVVGHAGHLETNRISIGIEVEALSTDGSGLTPALYQSTAALVRHLAAKYNIPLDRAHIIGHNEVTGCPRPGLGGKYCNPDPGASWDWNAFMEMVDGDPHTDWDAEPPSPTGHFPDVDINHSFFGYIEALYAIGAVRGTSAGLYLPDDAVTRGQTAKIMIETLAEARAYHDGECAFTDVCPGHTFYHYIRRLKELGITNGFSDGTYRPDAPLSRAAIASLIMRARGETPDYPVCEPPFSDVDCANVHTPNIRRLKELFEVKGFTVGYSDGTFHPDEESSRAAIAKFITIGLDRESFIPAFYDVLYDNKFYLYVEGIAERGITNGCRALPPLFCGEDELTRGQAAKFVIRALGEEPQYSDGISPFPDVAPGDTFYAYIRRLYELGVVSGFSDGLFRADQPITRGEIAKIIVRSLAVKGVVCQSTTDPGFSDVTPTDTFYTDIQCLKELRITSGFSDGTFRASKNITRSAAAKFMCLAFVQRTPALAQEESDVVNNAQNSAPNYAELIRASADESHAHDGAPRFTVPAGDEDWIRFETSSAQTTSITQDRAFVVSMSHLSFNAKMNVQIINAEGTVLVEAAGDAVSGEPSLRIAQSQLGADHFYVRLTNQNPFASEGAYGYLTINEAAPAACQPQFGVDCRQVDGFTVLRINVTSPRYAFETVMANDSTNGVEKSRERVREMVVRSPYVEKNPILAFNADYFGSGGPQGLIVKNGVRIPSAGSSVEIEAVRSSFSMARNGTMRLGVQSDCTAQTDGDCASWIPDPDRYFQTIGGGPLFIEDGARIQHFAGDLTPCLREEIDNTFCQGAFHWTAIGATQDGKTLLVVMSDTAKTMWQIGDMLLAEGAWQAMKLDGGGSTQLWYAGEEVIPSQDNRAIANALLVYYRTDECMPFCDVQESLFKPEIEFLAHPDRSVVFGFSDGLFHPERLVQRGEAASMLWRWMQWQVAAPTCAPTYPDLPDESSPHRQAIVALTCLEIMQGYSDGTVRPDKTLIRAEVISLVMRILRGLRPDKAGLFQDVSNMEPFSDIGGIPHEENIKLAHAIGLVNGYSDGTFRPDVETDRGQLAKIVARAVCFAHDDADAVPSEFTACDSVLRPYGLATDLYGEPPTASYGLYLPLLRR